MSNRSTLLHEMMMRKMSGDEILELISIMENKTDKEKERIALDLLSIVKEKYPLPSKDELLYKWDHDHDWKDMKELISSYWDSIEALLKDAISMKYLDIAAYLAPMFVFQENKSRFFPDGIIQTDMLELFGEKNLKSAEYYHSQPYCIKTESMSMTYTYPHNVQLIAYSEKLRMNGFARLINHYCEKYNIAEQELATEISSSNLERISPHSLHTLWADAVGDHLVLFPFGQEHEDTEWEDSKLNNLMIGNLLSTLNRLGWNEYFDGTVTVFGSVGYQYIASVTPDHADVVGDYYRNGTLVEQGSHKKSKIINIEI